VSLDRRDLVSSKRLALLLSSSQALVPDRVLPVVRPSSPAKVAELVVGRIVVCVQRFVPCRARSDERAQDDAVQEPQVRGALPAKRNAKVPSARGLRLETLIGSAAVDAPEVRDHVAVEPDNRTPLLDPECSAHAVQTKASRSFLLPGVHARLEPTYRKD